MAVDKDGHWTADDDEFNKMFEESQAFFYRELPGQQANYGPIPATAGPIVPVGDPAAYELNMEIDTGAIKVTCLHPGCPAPDIDTTINEMSQAYDAHNTIWHRED